MDGTVAHAQRPSGSFVIGDDLYLDVARAGHHSFEKHRGVSERLLRLRPRTLKRIGQLGLALHAANPTASAARGRLDHQGVAEARRVPARVFECRHFAATPWGDRNLRLLGELLGGDLVAQLAHHIAGRPDEDDPESFAEVSKPGVLGDEAPSRPNRLRARFDQRAFEAIVVEVARLAMAFAGQIGRRAKRIGFVGLAYEHRPAVGIRVERDRVKRLAMLLLILSRRDDESHRRFAAVYDCDTFEVRVAHRRSVHRHAERLPLVGVHILRKLRRLVSTEHYVEVAGFIGDMCIE